jgi:glycosyltransferase involved in cell wall biosynthesis
LLGTRRRWWLSPAVTHVADSLLYRDEYPKLPLLRTGFLALYARWSLGAMLSPPVTSALPEKLTIVVPSYKRPENLHPLVRALLKASFVERIIVSNNNPDIRMEDWIGLRDERLHIINQPKRTAPGIRFSLARETQGRFFATIDDDIFLSPTQLRTLFEALVRAPAMPHGVRGERYAPDEPMPYSREFLENFMGTVPDYGGWRPGMEGVDASVDVINGVYFFTREHLEELFRLAGELKLDVPELFNGEDILLSFCGTERPRIHALEDRFLNCLSEVRRGVATFVQEGFYPRRTQLFLSLRELKSLPGEQAPSKPPVAAGS